MNRIFEFSEFIVEARKIILNNITIFSPILRSDLGLSMPVDLIEEILKWDIIYKSPFSLSFYNKEKDWNTTIDKTLRVSDHWNFVSKKHPGNIHCKTNVPIENNKYWTIGEYDLENNQYKIIKNYPKENKEQNRPKIKKLKADSQVEYIQRKKAENIDFQNKINSGKIQITLYDGYIMTKDKSEVIGKVEQPIIGILNKMARGYFYLTEYETGKELTIRGRLSSQPPKYKLTEI